MSDRLTPLRHRRATGEPRLGTTSDPVAESSNPAVKRFKRGGHVESAMSKVKATSSKDASATRKMSKKGPSVSKENSTGVGALSASDMRGGSLPDGDEFKHGGSAKHKYAKGGSVTKGVNGW